MAKLNFPKIRNFTVTTTAQKLLDINAKRKAVLIYNNGLVSVELLDNRKQVYGNGIPIKAGAPYKNDHFNCQGEYYVICETGTVDIRVEETIQNEA